MKTRGRSTAAWLVVPTLLGIGVVGAKQWSKSDPLVATVSTAASGGERRTLWFTAVTEGRGVPGERSPDGTVRPDRQFPGLPSVPSLRDPTRPVLSDSAWGSEGLSSSLVGRAGGLGRADTRGVCSALGDGTAEAAYALERRLQETGVYVGAEQRVTARGDGTVPPELLELLQQMGPGPWEVDLRYRGVIVIREEAP